MVHGRPRRAGTLRAGPRASIAPDSYHYVVEGELRIRVDGEDGEGLVVGAGDVVLLPRNDLHLVGSDLTLPPVAGSDIIQPPKDGGLFSIHHGGGGRRTRDDLWVPRLR